MLSESWYKELSRSFMSLANTGHLYGICWISRWALAPVTGLQRGSQIFFWTAKVEKNSGQHELLLWNSTHLPISSATRNYWSDMDIINYISQKHKAAGRTSPWEQYQHPATGTKPETAHWVACIYAICSLATTSSSPSPWPPSSSSSSSSPSPPSPPSPPWSSSTDATSVSQLLLPIHSWDRFVLCSPPWSAYLHRNSMEGSCLQDLMHGESQHANASGLNSLLFVCCSYFGQTEPLHIVSDCCGILILPGTTGFPSLFFMNQAWGGNKNYSEVQRMKIWQPNWSPQGMCFFQQALAGKGAPSVHQKFPGISNQTKWRFRRKSDVSRFAYHLAPLDCVPNLSTCRTQETTCDPWPEWNVFPEKVDACIHCESWWVYFFVKFQNRTTDVPPRGVPNAGPGGLFELGFRSPCLRSFVWGKSLQLRRFWTLSFKLYKKKKKN